jgi:hypothetical protein
VREQEREAHLNIESIGLENRILGDGEGLLESDQRLVPLARVKQLRSVKALLGRLCY